MPSIHKSLLAAAPRGAQDARGGGVSSAGLSRAEETAGPARGHAATVSGRVGGTGEEGGGAWPEPEPPDKSSSGGARSLLPAGDLAGDLPAGDQPKVTYVKSDMRGVAGADGCCVGRALHRPPTRRQHPRVLLPRPEGPPLPLCIQTGRASLPCPVRSGRACLRPDPARLSGSKTSPLNPTLTHPFPRTNWTRLVLPPY